MCGCSTVIVKTSSIQNAPICLTQAFLIEQCVYTQTYQHGDITHHTMNHGGLTVRKKEATALKNTNKQEKEAAG